MHDEYDNRILIEPVTVYANNDFQDITTTDLYIHVAGGICDKLMGEASVAFSIPGCDWEREEHQVRHTLSFLYFESIIPN